MSRERSEAFYFPEDDDRKTEDLLKDVIEQERKKEFLRQVGFIYPIPEGDEEGYTDDENFSVSLDAIMLLGDKNFISNSTDGSGYA